MHKLTRHPIEIEYTPDHGLLPIFSFRLADFGGRPIINLSSSPMTQDAQFLKTCEDKILSLILLILLSPLMAVTSLLIKFTSPGPVLFIQERHGLNGKPIRVLKFRSMHIMNQVATREIKSPEEVSVIAMMTKNQNFDNDKNDAPGINLLSNKTDEAPNIPLQNTALVKTHLESTQTKAAEPKCEIFPRARVGDSRVTFVGKWIRKTSIDELPQLINVLFGNEFSGTTSSCDQT